MKNHIPLRDRDTMAQLRSALKQTRDPVLAVRLKAIILRKQGRTPQEVARSLLVSDRAVRNWVLAYNASGVPGLKPKPPGRPEGNPKWDSSVFNDLAREIDRGGYWSIPKMQEWLVTEKGVNIPEQTVWYRMDQLHYSYKSARPHPMQGSKERQEAFKKGGLLRSWSR